MEASGLRPSPDPVTRAEVAQRAEAALQAPALSAIDPGKTGTVAEVHTPSQP